MNIPTDLPLMAQMALTLAGFTGLVGASQRRDGRGFTTRERMHFGLIVETASFVVVLGFLPSALSLLPISREMVWRYSIIVMAAAHITTWVVLAYQTNMGREFFTELRGIEKAIGLGSLPFGITAVIAECALALGYFAPYAPFVYEIVLVLFITVGLYSFLSLLLNGEH